MSQFDLFAAPEAPATAPVLVPAPTGWGTQPQPAALAPALRQPPAIIKEGEAWETDVPGLKPLRVIKSDWLEVKISTEHFIKARTFYGSECNDDFVLLQLLEQAGVRMAMPPDDPAQAKRVYDYVASPFVIRRGTVPGYAITCRQPPAAADQEKA